MTKKILRILIAFLIIVIIPFPVFAVNEDYIPIQIDGYYDDWEDKPHTEVYPGKNPPANKINYVSLFRDEDYVYIHVIFAKKNNQGIKNMTIELFTNMGDESYFIFPDFWFNEINLNRQDMMPEEDMNLIPLEEDLNEEDTPEITEQEPNSSEQADGTGNSGLDLYSGLNQETYLLADNDKEKANNGKGKIKGYGTWSFTVWKNFLNWDDWDDWDGWDNWEDWDDWEDLFNWDDLIDWIDWFDWDVWAPVGSGYYTRTEGEPDELELYIPLSSITSNYDGITEISLKIKKLGQQIIMSTGVNTGAYVGVAVSAGIAMLSVGAYAFKKKQRFAWEERKKR
mgnify:CR=1 FL=1